MYDSTVSALDSHYVFIALGESVCDEVTEAG